MIRWFLLTPALLAGAFMMFVSRPAHADDATSQPASATGSVTVTVNDADGKPVPGAHVTITAPRAKKAAAAQAKGGGGKAKILAKGDTADDGTITLDGIPPGDYAANAKTDDGARGMAKVTITAGETATVTVVVKARKPAADAPPASAPAGN